MTEYRNANFTVLYSSDMIVLRGANHIIAAQAQKILERFAHSARPFQLKTATPDAIVLIPRP